MNDECAIRSRRFGSFFAARNGNNQGMKSPGTRNLAFQFHYAVLMVVCVMLTTARGEEVYRITLLNADVLTLTAFRYENDVGIGIHPLFGEMRISRDQITSVDHSTDHQPQSPSTPSSVGDESSGDSRPESQSSTTKWKRNIAASISGSEGNGDGVNARVSIEASRLTNKLRTQISATYVHDKDDVGTQRSRFDGDARNDWLITDSRWRVFAKGRAEYDEYADWNWRTTALSGLGYEIVDTLEHELVGRSGGGASRTFGGSDDTLAPIGVLGFDYTWRISERSALATAVDYTPDLSDLAEFRTESAAAYRIKIKEDQPLTLQIGSGHRYDSQASKTEKSDYEYFMSLGLDF